MNTKHRVNPIWAQRSFTKGELVCRECRQAVVGDGTTKNPWRHVGEPIEKGIVG